MVGGLEHGFYLSIYIYMYIYVYIYIRKDCCGRPNLTLHLRSRVCIKNNSCEIWVPQHSILITCVLISVQAPRINLD